MGPAAVGLGGTVGLGPAGLLGGNGFSFGLLSSSGLSSGFGGGLGTGLGGTVTDVLSLLAAT